VSSPWALVVGDVIDDVHVVTDGPIRDNTDTLADIQVRPGGSAANTACWLGYLGSPVRFLAGWVRTTSLDTAWSLNALVSMRTSSSMSTTRPAPSL